MKITIDGKVSDVSFWSFLKCNLITSIAITLILYAIAFVIIVLMSISNGGY